MYTLNNYVGIIAALLSEESAKTTGRYSRTHFSGSSVLLEEYARTMIAREEMHLGEVEKMLRKPGDTTPFRAA